MWGIFLKQIMSYMHMKNKHFGNINFNGVLLELEEPSSESKSVKIT